MTFALPLLLATLQTAPAALAPPVAPSIEVQCPTLSLARTGARGADLSARDFASWRGPLLELHIPVGAEEAAAFGQLQYLRLNGKIYAGGLLSRRVDEGGAMRFVLSFDAGDLAALTAGAKLELVVQDGAGLALDLAKADAALLQSCLDKEAMAADPGSDPTTRRNFTFLVMEPNQPLRIRSRGNASNYYPTTALREGREGVSRIGVTIGASGRIIACDIVTSSGHADLDATSCRVARISTYLPATDAAGLPIETKAEQNLVWKVAE